MGVPHSRRYARHDVWTNAGRPDDAELYCVAVDVSSTLSSTLRRVLTDEGWRVELRDPTRDRNNIAARRLSESVAAYPYATTQDAPRESY
jgi:hypothetical protein